MEFAVLHMCPDLCHVLAFSGDFPVGWETGAGSWLSPVHSALLQIYSGHLGSSYMCDLLTAMIICMFLMPSS